MRIVREYFGLDRTTVVYENEISGVGGNAGEFFVVAEIGSARGASSARTTVTFSHDEMSRILADYRRHYPVDGATTLALISGPRIGGFLARVRRWLAALFSFRFRRRRRSDSGKPPDRGLATENAA